MTCPICGAYAPPCPDTGYDGDEPCSEKCSLVFDGEPDIATHRIEKE